MSILAFVGSAAFGALCAAFGAFFISERKINIENVTQERKQWRADVRILSAEVCDALLSEDAELPIKLRTKFSVLLNPHDPEDVGIINNIALTEESQRAALIADFAERVALLLKHDWERAKHESSLLQWIIWQEPSRARFEDYQRGDRRVYRVVRPWVGRLMFWRPRS